MLEQFTKTDVSGKRAATGPLQERSSNRHTQPRTAGRSLWKGRAGRQQQRRGRETGPAAPGKCGRSHPSFTLQNSTPILRRRNWRNRPVRLLQAPATDDDGVVCERVRSPPPRPLGATFLLRFLSGIPSLPAHRGQPVPLIPAPWPLRKCHLYQARIKAGM